VVWHFQLIYIVFVQKVLMIHNNNKIINIIFIYMINHVIK